MTDTGFDEMGSFARWLYIYMMSEDAQTPEVSEKIIKNYHADRRIRVEINGVEIDFESFANKLEAVMDKNIEQKAAEIMADELTKLVMKVASFTKVIERERERFLAVFAQEDYNDE